MPRKKLFSSFDEHPEQRYTQPQLAEPVKSERTHIETDPRYQAVAAVLYTLQTALQKIENEITVIRVQKHLASHPDGPHADWHRTLLQKLRPDADVPLLESHSAPLEDLDAQVEKGLQAARDETGSVQHDTGEQVVKLERRAITVRAGIFAQHTKLEAIRSELSFEMAERQKAAHRDLTLAQYRAAQVFARATDALREFQRSVIEAGYTWRPDVLPQPLLRSALMLGSEFSQNSEIAHARRFLEEAKLL